MDKTYISAGELLADSFRLAARIFHSGFRPDFVVGVWRGGAPVALAVHEYLQLRGIVTSLIAIQASSYTGIDQRSRTAAISGLGALVDRVQREHALLIVDDVFDTGFTLSCIVEQLRQAAGPRCPGQIRIACPWFKPTRNRTPIKPDYYLHETSHWLVFPHELAGLTPDELRQKPDLKGTLGEIDL